MASGLVASEVRLAITDKMLVREKLEKEFVHLKLFLYWIWVFQTNLEFDKLVLKIR